jgi:ubiquinone/menaquinone biosynthesis C-methylase UbiE
MQAVDSSKAPPYFDLLFHRLAQNHPETVTAFGRHVHWGCWDDPASADGSAANYAVAAERLCRRFFEVAQIRDGQRILDVGCGFGGTIATLNEHYSNLELVGVNIDPRQLERARDSIRPHNGNRILFVEGDACQLDLRAGSFDVVLAIESVFHFDDRAAFFQGAAKALVPGGRMVLSDFVPPERALPLLQVFDPTTDRATRHTYGRINVLCSVDSYRKLGQQTGLELGLADDITTSIMPTYSFLRKHFRAWPNADDARLFDQATAQLEIACRARLLTYSILGFRKKAVSHSRAA